MSDRVLRKVLPLFWPERRSIRHDARTMARIVTALRVIFNAIYEFDPPARGLSLELRLRPLAQPAQSSWGVRVATLPDLEDRRIATDAYGVLTETGAISRSVRRLQVNADLGILLLPAARLPEIAVSAEDLAPEDWAAEDWALKGMPAGPRRDLSFASGLDIIRAATAGWVYDVRTPPSRRTLARLAMERRGGCEDAARLCAAVLRRRGAPVRFVAGYLGPPDAPARKQSRRHAWLAVWTRDRGWSEIDPLDPAGCIPLVATAWGPTLAALQPIAGTFAVGVVKRSSIEIQIAPVPVRNTG
jgi:hypothetical protein